MLDQEIISKIRTQNCKGKMFILKFIFSAFKLTLEIFCLALRMNFMVFCTETE